MGERARAGTEPGWRVIDAAVGSACRRLGGELVSAYAIGSLAHGGFSANVSDVDLALLTSGRRTVRLVSLVRAIAADVRLEVHDELASRLSIFHAPWLRLADPPPSSRFPAIDRQDLIRFGVLVHGEDLRDRYATAPSEHEIRVQAIDAALGRLTAKSLADQLSATPVTARQASKLVLWPVRLQHVCETAVASGNRDAVEHYVDTPDASHVTLVGEALRWRERGSIDNLDDARVMLADEVIDLHIEIFERLGSDRRLPRRIDLAHRAASLRARTVGA